MAQQQRPAVPVQVSPQEELRGRVEILRGWVAALDRIIGIRTRVLLVLAAIAIGASGAAIYLALHAESEGASKAEVRALRRQVESGGAAASPRSGLEARLQTAESEAAAAKASAESLRSEVSALRAQIEGQSAGSTAGAATGPSGASGGVTGVTGASGSTGATGSKSAAGSPTVPAD